MYNVFAIDVHVADVNDFERVLSGRLECLGMRRGGFGELNGALCDRGHLAEAKYSGADLLGRFTLYFIRTIV